VIQAFPAPTFGHVAEAFVVAHAAPGAWAAGTAVKYRQTLAALGGQLVEHGPGAASWPGGWGTSPLACGTRPQAPGKPATAPPPQPRARATRRWTICTPA
jgi:hypothetical protein